jgi:hypothetical protein
MAWKKLDKVPWVLAFREQSSREISLCILYFSVKMAWKKTCLLCVAIILLHRLQLYVQTGPFIGMGKGGKAFKRAAG